MENQLVIPLVQSFLTQDWCKIIHYLLEDSHLLSYNIWDDFCREEAFWKHIISPCSPPDGDPEILEKLLIARAIRENPANIWRPCLNVERSQVWLESLIGVTRPNAIGIEINGLYCSLNNNQYQFNINVKNLNEKEVCLKFMLLLDDLDKVWEVIEMIANTGIPNLSIESDVIKELKSLSRTTQQLTTKISTEKQLDILHSISGVPSLLQLSRNTIRNNMSHLDHLRFEELPIPKAHIQYLTMGDLIAYDPKNPRLLGRDYIPNSICDS